MFAIKSFTDAVIGKVYCVAERQPGGRWLARSYHRDMEGAEVVFQALVLAGRGGETLDATVRAMDGDRDHD